MGFSGGLSDDVTRIIMGFIREVLSPFISSAIRRLAAFFKNPLKFLKGNSDKDKEEASDYDAKNPPPNAKILSTTRHGVFFGTWRDKYVIKPEETDGHILVVGGTGTGKSSCIAIPTLRSWKGRIFAIDIKGELYKNTVAKRKNIKVFEPTNKNGRYVYDPYFFINDSTNSAQEAFAIARAIMPLSPDVREPFWIESAYNLLAGAILHFHHEGQTFIETLRKMLRLNPEALVKVVSQSSNPKAELCAASLVDIDNKVLTGIAAEIYRVITQLVTDDDIVRGFTCTEGKEIIYPADLQDKNGADVYIKIPPYLLEQWKNLLTLMVNQFIRFFERREESLDNRPILFLLDEFPTLGKIPAVNTALATLRSKKITICIIIQSLAQLDMIYGHDARKVIADNCDFKAILSATDADTQEYFSKLIGTYEKVRRSHSQSYDDYLGAPSGRGEQTSRDEKCVIIKPEEFAALQDELILLYRFPKNFCRVKKQPYYLNSPQDVTFDERF